MCNEQGLENCKIEICFREKSVKWDFTASIIQNISINVIFNLIKTFCKALESTTGLVIVDVVAV